jgi:hypothetical protein
MWKSLAPLGLASFALLGCPNTTGTTAVALTASECTQLGGTVSSDSTCGGLNKKCTTTTVSPVTKEITTHSLCINAQ